MVDTLTTSRRSWNMSRIRSKNTRPEVTVRSILHRQGYRFTVNGPLNKSLPGKPDIVFPKFKLAVFVHGCFWHRHKGCKFAYEPKSRVSFWTEKLRKNVERDIEVIAQLEEMDWHSLVIWECEVREDPKSVVKKFKELIRAQSQKPFQGKVYNGQKS